MSVSALEEYKDAFRDLAVLYPESWHLLVVAEDRCRGEHFTRLKRELELKHTKGLSFEFGPDQPWDGVFRAAARDREYWDKSVREPAPLFRTAGKGHKEQSGGTGSGTDQTGKVSPKKRPKKSQKDRLKAQLAKYRDTPGESGPVSKGQYPGQDSSHGKGKGRGPKRDGKGRFTTDRQGKPICFAFNSGECKGVCPKNMVHVCQVCLGSHPAKECGKGANT